MLIRLKGSASLHNDLIQSLKEHASLEKGALPSSFDASLVRQMYLRLKSAKNLQLSEKNLEYFLYLFKQLKMWPEVIDLCTNFEKLSGKTEDTNVNEIKAYYMSETLL